MPTIPLSVTGEVLLLKRLHATLARPEYGRAPEIQALRAAVQAGLQTPFVHQERASVEAKHMKLVEAAARFADAGRTRLRALRIDREGISVRLPNMHIKIKGISNADANLYFDAHAILKVPDPGRPVVEQIAPGIHSFCQVPQISEPDTVARLEEVHGELLKQPDDMQAHVKLVVRRSILERLSLYAPKATNWINIAQAGIVLDLNDQSLLARDGKETIRYALSEQEWQTPVPSELPPKTGVIIPIEGIKFLLDTGAEEFQMEVLLHDVANCKVKVQASVNGCRLAFACHGLPYMYDDWPSMIRSIKQLVDAFETYDVASPGMLVKPLERFLQLQKIADSSQEKRNRDPLCCLGAYITDPQLEVSVPHYLPDFPESAIDSRVIGTKSGEEVRYAVSATRLLTSLNYCSGETRIGLPVVTGVALAESLPLYFQDGSYEILHNCRAVVKGD
jgi:hypothetical protein